MKAVLILILVFLLALVASQGFNKTLYEISRPYLKERVYFRGMRQRGDVLLEEDGKTLTFDAPQKTNSVSYRFPIQKRKIYKELITYVEVHAHQDSSEGDLFVTTKGINQHLISFDVIANNVKIFATKVKVYGKLK